MVETFPRVTQWSGRFGGIWQIHQGSSDSPAYKIPSFIEPRIGINMRAAPHSKTKLMFTFAEDLREVF